MKILIKLQLVILFLGVINNQFDAQASSTARNESVRWQSLNHSLNAFLTESGLNISDDEITEIRTKDERPENGVTIQWKYNCPSENRNCRILRLNVLEDGTVRTKTLDVKVSGPLYSYKDTTIVSGTATYYYRVLMQINPVKWVISKTVFTVPQPEILECSDWQHTETLQHYINGRTTKLKIDPASLQSDGWKADSIEIKWTPSSGEDEPITPADNSEIDLNNKLIRYTDGSEITFQVRSWDDEHNISRWSKPWIAILDTSPPVLVGEFKVIPGVDEEGNQAWIDLSWGAAKDLVPNVYAELHQLKRSIGSPENFLDSIEFKANQDFSLTYRDSTEQTNTTIYYQLEATDRVGNSGVVATGSARLLIGPQIEVNGPDASREIIIRCPEYDLYGVEGFILSSGEASSWNISMDQVESIGPGFQIRLRVEMLNPTQNEVQLRLRAKINQAGETNLTTWSNSESVCWPTCVQGLSVTNNKPSEYTQFNDRDGNIYLKWDSPGPGMRHYVVWRGETRETLEKIAEFDSDELKWVDQYGWDESTNLPGDELFVFQKYYYAVTEGEGNHTAPFDVDCIKSTYCNRAPVIESLSSGYFRPDFDSFKIELAPEWFEHLAVDLANIKFTGQVDMGENSNAYTFNAHIEDGYFVVPDKDQILIESDGKDGESGDFLVWAKRIASIDSTSKSATKTAILDRIKPVFNCELSVEPQMVPDSSNWRMHLTWESADDNTSGVDHYILKRRKGNGLNIVIDGSLSGNDTEYNDKYGDIAQSTKVTYTLVAVDGVDYQSTAISGSSWCFLKPVIDVDSVVTESTVTVKCSEYTENKPVGYNYVLNGVADYIPTSDATFDVTTGLRDGHNSLRVQAKFRIEGEDYLSEWSKQRIVEFKKIPPAKVTNLKVTNTPDLWPDGCNPWDGNLYLQWEEADNACKYNVYRASEALPGNFKLIGITTGTQWIDYSDSCEINPELPDDLKIFQTYLYKVEAENSEGVPGEFSDIESDYCNQAPVIKDEIFEYFGPNVKLRIPLESDWFEDLGVPVYSLSFNANILINGGETIFSLRLCENNILEADVQILFPVNTSGDTCLFKVRADLREKPLTTSWSKRADAVYDCKGPILTESLNLEPILEQNSPGEMKLTWKPAKAELSKLRCYRIYRRIGDGQMDSLVENYPATATTYNDCYDNIGQSAQVAYEIVAVDMLENIGNKIGNSSWCLLRPQLTTPDTVNESRVVVGCTQYPLEGLIGYNYYLNGNLMSVDTNTYSFEVPSLMEGENTLEVQTRFAIKEIEYFSAWSEPVTIEYKDPCLGRVTGLNVTNILPEWAKECSNPWDGNIYLTWDAVDNACKYNIYRAKTSSFNNAALVDTTPETSWIDYYDNPKNGKQMTIFQTYYYWAEALNEGNVAGERSEVESNYCNRAPEIISKCYSKSLTTVRISWEKLPTNVTIHQAEQYSYDCDSGSSQIKDISKDSISHNFRIELNKKYTIKIRALKDDLQTAWSKCISCDYRTSTLPCLSLFKLQPQPGECGILVSWEQYRDLLDVCDIAELDSFSILRWLKEKPDDIFINSFSKSDFQALKKWSYLDNYELIPQKEYYYEIIPYQITEDSLVFTPGDTALGKATHKTDRVFIPQIDTISLKENKSAKKLYFDASKDQLTINWKWLENAEAIAGICTVMVAKNNKFNGSDDEVKKNPITIDPNRLINETTFENISAINKFPGLPYQIKLTAIDEDFTEHGYYSSDWDGIVEVYPDSEPPVQFKLNPLKTFAPDTCIPEIVNLVLNWPQGSDNESGLSHYILKYDILDINNNYIPYYSNLYYTTCCTLLIDYNNPKITDPQNFYRFHIHHVDLVGLESIIDDYDIFCKYWTPLECPQNLEVKHIDEKQIKATWDKVYINELFEADEYQLQWCDVCSLLGHSTNPHANPNPPINFWENRHPRWEKKYYFHVKAFDMKKNESGWSKIASNKDAIIPPEEDMIQLELPSSPYITNNYPNPFNPETRIKYGLPDDTQVNIKIYNTNGQEVRSLIDLYQPAGHYHVLWDGKDNSGNPVASGIYFYVIKTGNFYKINKCTLLK